MIDHANNIGRCGHIANAGYAVNSACRGKHISKICIKTKKNVKIKQNIQYAQKRVALFKHKINRRL